MSSLHEAFFKFLFFKELVYVWPQENFYQPYWYQNRYELRQTSSFISKEIIWLISDALGVPLTFPIWAEKKLFT